MRLFLGNLRRVIFAAGPDRHGATQSIDFGDRQMPRLTDLQPAHVERADRATNQPHHLVIEPGQHLIETPVGVVSVTLEDRNTASFENVESYRLVKNLEIDVPGIGPVR